MQGLLLVAAQFALIGWLIWPFTPQTWSPPAMLLAGAALVLGVWTLAHNRPGNFNIRPEPKADGQLVTGGPYRWTRHPMYLAVLLFGAAEAQSYDDPWKTIAWIALFVVLRLKSQIEEAGLQAKFPGYAAYARRTGRFIPRLW